MREALIRCTSQLINQIFSKTTMAMCVLQDYRAASSRSSRQALCIVNRSLYFEWYTRCFGSCILCSLAWFRISGWEYLSLQGSVGIEESYCHLLCQISGFDQKFTGMSATARVR